MAKKLKQNIQPVDGLMISKFDVILYNKQGYSDILVAVKDRVRADALAKWWPWKAKVEAHKSTALKKNRVAVHLVQGAEDTVYWVWNSALAARMCVVWEQVRRKNRAYFRDYTLSCLCGGTVMVGDSAGQIKCTGCSQFPNFKPYTGPWNPLGFCETKPVKAETKPVKAETKPVKAETKPGKPAMCTMQVVNRHSSDFDIYIGRGTPYGNPFKATELGRAEALARFERYARNKLMKVIEALPADAVLGCSCKPKACHGDIIVKLWREIHGQITQKKLPGKRAKSPGSWQTLL